MVAFGLTSGKIGNVRTEILRAFSEIEARGALILFRRQPT